MSARAQSGMMLVEVLVALAILGLVVASIMTLLAQTARFSAAAEDRAIAAIVADNVAVEALATRTTLERGRRDFEIDLGGARWTAAREVAPTAVDGVVRIDVAVRKEAQAQALARITTLKSEAP